MTSTRKGGRRRGTTPSGSCSNSRPPAFVPQSRWSDFELRLQAVVSEFDTFRTGTKSWFREAYPGTPLSVGLFAAEFALADCLPIAAGGLGAVAGETLKTASALGVPTVGVGLRYSETSHQWLDADCRQHETWETVAPSDLPVTLARDRLGFPVVVTAPLPHGPVGVRVWEARGRAFEAPAPRHRRRGQHARRSGDRATPVPERSRNPAAPVRRPRVRRLSRARRARGGADRRAPERRSYRVRRPRPDRCVDGASSVELRRGLCRRRAGHRLHDAHTGPGRPRLLRSRVCPPGAGADRRRARCRNRDDPRGSGARPSTTHATPSARRSWPCGSPVTATG